MQPAILKTGPIVLLLALLFSSLPLLASASPPDRRETLPGGPAIQDPTPNPTPEPSPAAALTLILQENSLTLFTPGTEVPLSGLVFRITLGGTIQEFPLRSYSGLAPVLDNASSPTCFRLALAGTTADFPAVCDEATRYRHEVTPDERFWWFEETGLPPDIFITNGEEEQTLCYATTTSTQICNISYRGEAAAIDVAEAEAGATDSPDEDASRDATQEDDSATAVADETATGTDNREEAEETTTSTDNGEETTPPEDLVPAALAFSVFDGSTWTIESAGLLGGGPPQVLFEDGTTNLHPAWSPDGTRLVFASDFDGDFDLYLRRADSQNLFNLTDTDADEGFPAWSPDGQQIAFWSNRDGNPDIYVMDADGENVTRLTDHEADDISPAWSPDGQQIAFRSERDGNWEIYVMDSDGDNPTRLTENPALDDAPVWSPDGQQIAFHSTRGSEDDNAWQIMVMEADGTNPRTLVDLEVSTLDIDPAWSPDGSQLAFSATVDGRADIYLIDLVTSELSQLTRTDDLDERFPTWQMGAPHPGSQPGD